MKEANMSIGGKRIGFYGSCHAEAMSRLFLATPRLRDNYEVLYSLPYYVMDEEGIANFTNNILPTLDYFIYQPISQEAEEGKFATAPMLGNLKPGAKTITFAYSHFELYSPFCLYAPNNFPEFPPLFVDYEVAALVAQGHSLDEIIAGIEHRKVLEYSNVLLEQNLSELRKREERVLPGDKPIDVLVSDYIAENFKIQQLFNCMNHPSNVLLKEIASRILEKMEPHEASVERGLFSDEGKEFLNDAYTPVPKIITEAYDLKNTWQRQMLRDNEMSRVDYLTLQYNYFSAIKTDDIVSAIENLSWSRPWFKALL
jgi:hypothetical protein